MLEGDDAVDAPDENLLEIQNAGKTGCSIHPNFVSIIRFIKRDQFLSDSHCCYDYERIYYLFSDNSDRAFFKELVKVVELSDVILEVLDARDPLGTRCVDMEKMVRRLGPEKHLVLLLNKIGIVC